jgi:hypothetical protein
MHNKIKITLEQYKNQNNLFLFSEIIILNKYQFL